MTTSQMHALFDLKYVSEQLSELPPAHPYMPGLFRRHDGIVKQLHRSGMTNDDIDTALDSL